MDTINIRKKNVEKIESLGYQINPNLPLLETVEIKRSSKVILGRILILHACAACAYGFPKVNALYWLKQEELIEYITDPEQKYLQCDSISNKTTYQWRVEAIWSLCWIAGYHSDLDFSKPCSDSLIKILPDLKNMVSSDEFRQNYKIRHKDEIAEMLDLAYCLHWSIREENLRGGNPKIKNDKVQGQVIEERRRGLEWVVGDEEWEETLLDT